jgi:heme/copper-type cytochrome/quinol oxidase subunit 2
MRSKRAIRFTLFIAGAAATLFAWSYPALAQCAMCKNAVTGSPEAAKLSQSLNFAILILLIPPVLIFCGIFFVAYRYRKSRGTTETVQSLSEDESRRGAGLAKPGTRRKNGAERETGGALA